MVGNVDSIHFEPAVFYGYWAVCTDELHEIHRLFHPDNFIASERDVSRVSIIAFVVI